MTLDPKAAAERLRAMLDGTFHYTAYRGKAPDGAPTMRADLDAVLSAPSKQAPLEGVKSLADRANAYDKPDHGEGPHDDREWVQVTLGELRALRSALLPASAEPVAGMVYAPHVLVALQAALEAVNHSMPAQAHYPEPQDRHEKAARLLRDAIASFAPPASGAVEAGWQDMSSAPRDGTIVELRSASAFNPVVFLAGYVRPKGLVAKLWCPVKGQKVGGLPWKDSEIDAWRPAAPTEGR